MKSSFLTVYRIVVYRELMFQTVTPLLLFGTGSFMVLLLIRLSVLPLIEEEGRERLRFCD